MSAKTGEGIDEWRDWLARVGQRGGGARLSHLLGSDVLDRALAERTRPTAAFFEAESERLARLCHRMAERFARGGRLIALGRSPAARSDARHVAVEFVHPVIVGKRALPALALAGEGGPLVEQVALAVEPGDIVDRLRRRTPMPPLGARSRARLPDARLRAGRRAEWEFEPPSQDASIRQELVETLYHVLWELVHVFFDHRGLLEGREARRTHDTGASSFLYPFLAEGETTSRRSSEDVRRSIAREGGGGRASCGPRRSRTTATSCSPRPPACAPTSRPAAACSRSVTAARPPTRWTWWPTSAARPIRAGGRGARST